jgi:hypothetical protein
LLILFFALSDIICNFAAQTTECLSISGKIWLLATTEKNAKTARLNIIPTDFKLFTMRRG